MELKTLADSGFKISSQIQVQVKLQMHVFSSNTSFPFDTFAIVKANKACSFLYLRTFTCHMTVITFPPSLFLCPSECIICCSNTMFTQTATQLIHLLPCMHPILPFLVSLFAHVILDFIILVDTFTIMQPILPPPPPRNVLMTYAKIFEIELH